MRTYGDAVDDLVAGGLTLAQAQQQAMNSQQAANEQAARDKAASFMGTGIPWWAVGLGAAGLAFAVWSSRK